MKAVASTFAAAAALSAATMSHACDIRDVRISGALLKLDYNGFESGPTSVQAPVTLRGGADCASARIEYAVLPDPSFPMNAGVLLLGQGANTLQAEIVNRAGVNLLQPQAAAAFANAAPSARFGSTGSDLTDQSLTLRLAPGQNVAPGDYRGRVRLQARGLDSEGVAGKVAETVVDLVIHVPPVVFLTAAATRRIDFGELSNDRLSEPFAFDAWTNVDYTLVVKSDNQWQLRRAGESQRGVGYRVNLEGRDLDMPAAGPNRVTYDVPRGLRRRHDMRLRVDQIDGRPAGAYSDVITIEIQARV